MGIINEFQDYVRQIKDIALCRAVEVIYLKSLKTPIKLKKTCHMIFTGS